MTFLTETRSLKTLFSTLPFFFLINLFFSTSLPLNGQIYSGIWHKHTEKERILTGVKWGRFNDTNKKLQAKGFRLHDIEVTDVKGQKRFHGFWHSKKGTGKDSCIISVRKEWAAFEEIWGERESTEYALVDIETYKEGHQRKFIGIWRELDVRERVSEPTNWFNFKKRWEELGQEGYLLIDIEVFRDNGAWFYVGVFHEAAESGTNYRLWVDLDQGTFLTIHQGLEDQGFYMIDLEVYRKGKNTRYIGVWTTGQGRMKETNFREHALSKLTSTLNRSWGKYKGLWDLLDKDNVRLYDLELRQ